MATNSDPFPFSTSSSQTNQPCAFQSSGKVCLMQLGITQGNGIPSGYVVAWCWNLHRGCSVLIDEKVS